MSNVSDRELVDRMLDGDATAHDLFVERFNRLVWALVTRLLASFTREQWEDAYQEVFLRLHLQLRMWSGGQLSVWVGRVAVRRLMTIRAKIGKRNEFPLEDSLQPVDRNRTPAEDAERAEWLKRIEPCIEQCMLELPQPQRTLVQMALGGIPPCEIQRSIGVSHSTYYYWLRNIRERLKSRLGDD